MLPRFAALITTGSAAVLTLGVALSACSSSGGDGSSTVDAGADVTHVGADAQVTTADAGPCAPDESAPVPVDRCTTDPADTAHPQCGAWLKVELPGTVCGDGSQFKFFVNWSNTSNDLLVGFEPGGACWDYDSCSGNAGVRGAANPHGIPDNHMDALKFLNLLRRTPDNPAQGYNMVFVPYCTGDIHTGNNVMTYTSGGALDGGAGDGGDGGAGDAGTSSLTFHHAGHANTLAVIDWLKKSFPVVPKLFVTGCSAGGAGTILNYHFIRAGLGSQAQCGYMLDDSGPIFHSSGPSKQLHTKIRAAWNVDPVLDSLPTSGAIDPAAIKGDFGLINTFVAREFPRDRLSLVLYQMDLNYSLYSYQRFFPGSTEAQIHAMWRQDIDALIPTYQAQPNLAYYLPFFRTDNCSHCVSIPPLGDPPAIPTDTNAALNTPWLGSDIKESMIDLKAFTTDLLDDSVPLKSYEEKAQVGAFSPAVSAQCMQGG